jgi:6,7-dimethyl-8-ribityllumazine synthase
MSLYFPERPVSSLVHPPRISIIASRYNNSFVDVMLEQAEQELLAIVPATKIEVIRVQGAFEIPVIAKVVATRRSPDAIIALGVILQGETAHARLIATSITDALMRLSLDHALPIIHEVLLLEHEKQAADRCLSESVNRGVEAARAAFTAIEAAHSIQNK